MPPFAESVRARKILATVLVLGVAGCVQGFIAWRTQPPVPARSFPKNLSEIAP